MNDLRYRMISFPDDKKNAKANFDVMSACKFKGHLTQYIAEINVNRNLHLPIPICKQIQEQQTVIST